MNTFYVCHKYTKMESATVVTSHEILVHDIPSLFVSFILREENILYVGFATKQKLLIVEDSVANK